MKTRHCVVIGGGLAGLAAAYRLTQNKWKVTLVEATERLGGRVKSYRFPGEKNLVCELGGEWIGENHREMRRLCCTFGLELQRHQYSNSFWGSKTPIRFIGPGKWCLSEEAKHSWNRFARRFKKFGYADYRRMDQLDWWTFLEEELKFKRADLLRRDLMDSTDFGESIRQNSAYTAAAEYLSSNGQEVDETDEMDYKVVGGNSRLVEALTEAIGRKYIKKRCEVKRVKQKGRHVWVSCPGVRIEKADACVCAVPAHCLGRIDWDPRLPPRQRQAAERLQYARITKTAVLCRQRFWDKPKDGGFAVCTTLASDFCFESTYGQEGNKGILCSYAIGDKADDIAESPEQALKNWIVKDVADSNGFSWKDAKVERMALKVKRMPWQHDAFTGGAYALYRPGQWFTVRPALEKPHKRVFFAGEHLADWQGFMEGAVVTGQKAADAVLRLP